MSEVTWPECPHGGTSYRLRNTDSDHYSHSRQCAWFKEYLGHAIGVSHGICTKCHGHGPANDQNPQLRRIARRWMHIACSGLSAKAQKYYPLEPTLERLMALSNEDFGLNAIELRVRRGMISPEDAAAMVERVQAKRRE